MKQLLEILIWTVVLCLVAALIEANYQMLTIIAPHPVLWLTAVKSFGFGIATILVIIFHQKQVVKLLFVLIDALIIFSFQYFPVEAWKEIASYIYATYTGLILGFVGFAASDIYNRLLTTGTIARQLKKLEYYELTEEKNKLTNTGRGEKWENIPERAKRVKHINWKLENLKKELRYE